MSQMKCTQKQTEPQKLHEILAPKFTKGVEEYYVNLGKNINGDKTRDLEIKAILKGTPTDYIFNELVRRYESLSLVFSGIAEITGVDRHYKDIPENIYPLWNRFKDLQSDVDNIRKAAKI